MTELRKSPRPAAPVDRPTVVPPFDAEEYARDSESELAAARARGERQTTPPSALHGSLRDSCKDLRKLVELETRSSRTELAHAATPRLDSVVVPLVSEAELERLGLDSAALALLAVVDGEMIVEEILAVTHVEIADGLATLATLAKAGLVAFGVAEEASDRGTRVSGANS